MKKFSTKHVRDTKRHLKRVVSTRTYNLFHLRKGLVTHKIQKPKGANVRLYGSTHLFPKVLETNIGKSFLKLVDKHFPRGKKIRGTDKELHTIFNRNSVKVSYCCMKNVGSIISSHNQGILHPPSNNYGCNCEDTNTCPLDGKCLTPEIVYKANVSNNIDNDKRFYIGMTNPPFKERSRNHNRDFNHERYRNSTDLSKYVWSLKDSNKQAKIKYEVVHKVLGKAKLNYCRLCLTEKMEIIANIDDENLLNKRSEFISKCRHQNKYLLKPGKRKEREEVG